MVFDLSRIVELLSTGKIGRKSDSAISFEELILRSESLSAEVSTLATDLSSLHIGIGEVLTTPAGTSQSAFSSFFFFRIIFPVKFKVFVISANALRFLGAFYCMNNKIFI